MDLTWSWLLQSVNKLFCDHTDNTGIVYDQHAVNGNLIQLRRRLNDVSEHGRHAQNINIINLLFPVAVVISHRRPC